MPDYKLATRRAALKIGVDPAILEALVRQESGFNKNARSPAGARGIAQFMPGTAPGYGVNLNDNRVTDDLEGAARYLKAGLQKYGSYAKALSVYNSGRPDAYKDPNFAKGQTYNYVRSILSGAKDFQGAPTTSAKSPGARTSTETTTTRTTPGVDNSAARAAAVLQFLQTKGADPVAAALQARALQDVPGHSVTTSSSGASAPSASAGNAQPIGKGIANFEGKKVAAWIAPVLAYARANGWKGTVTSGYRSFADQTRIYNSGVRPAAKPGTSNHEGTDFPRGAVDVSDAAQLSAIIRQSKYASLLQWAGAKDPPHFSHPHGGSY